MYGKSLGAVAIAALRGGIEALAKIQLEIFSPIAPMLAQTATDVAEALEAIHGAAAFEWKMDGARIQVHKLGQEVRIYTRSLNEITAAIPEIAELVRSFPQHALVLDGEAIAFDSARRPHPFQVTMRRFGRKLNVDALRRTLPIEAFFFDCLRIGEDSIATRTTQERFEALTRAVPAALLIPRLITDSEPAARAFYEAAIAAGHEGVMAKACWTRTPYEAGKTVAGRAGSKSKRVHTLDLVVLGAEWGNGRRSGKLSNLHLGALDSATGEYIMLGKTFKGLTDAMLARQTQEFLKRETRRDANTVYIRPEMVVEIAFSDLQTSSRYPGGMALRLARVKRYRDDKPVEEADTMDSVRKIFAAQTAAARRRESAGPPSAPKISAGHPPSRQHRRNGQNFSRPPGKREQLVDALHCGNLFQYRPGWVHEQQLPARMLRQGFGGRPPNQFGHFGSDETRGLIGRRRT